MKINRSESKRITKPGRPTPAPKGPARGVTPRGGASSEAPATGPERFTLYGFAPLSQGGPLRGIATLRERTQDGRGSRLLRSRVLPASWPANRKGYSAAEAWSLACNIARNAHRRADAYRRAQVAA